MVLELMSGLYCYHMMKVMCSSILDMRQALFHAAHSCPWSAERKIVWKRWGDCTPPCPSAPPVPPPAASAAVERPAAGAAPSRAPGPTAAPPSAPAPPSAAAAAPRCHLAASPCPPLAAAPLQSIPDMPPTGNKQGRRLQASKHNQPAAIEHVDLHVVPTHNHTVSPFICTHTCHPVVTLNVPKPYIGNHQMELLH